MLILEAILNEVNCFWLFSDVYVSYKKLKFVFNSRFKMYLNVCRLHDVKMCSNRILQGFYFITRDIIMILRKFHEYIVH